MKKLINIIFEQYLKDATIEFSIKGGKLDGKSGRGTFKGIINYVRISII